MSTPEQASQPQAASPYPPDAYGQPGPRLDQPAGLTPGVTQQPYVGGYPQLYPGAIPEQRQPTAPAARDNGAGSGSKKSTGKIITAGLVGLVAGILIGSSGSGSGSSAPSASVLAPAEGDSPVQPESSGSSSPDPASDSGPSAPITPSGPPRR